MSRVRRAGLDEPVKSMRSLLLPAATGLGIAVLVMAMGPAASAGIRRGAPPGFHTVVVRKAGLALAVPDSWLPLDPKATFDEAKARNPKSALDPKHFPFMARGAAEPGHWHPNMNVHLDALAREAVRYPEGLLAATRIRHPDATATATTVGGRPAVQITFSSEEPASDSVATVHHLGYFFSTPVGVVDVNFAMVEDPSTDPAVQTMVASIRVLRDG